MLAILDLSNLATVENNGTWQVSLGFIPVDPQVTGIPTVEPKGLITIGATQFAHLVAFFVATQVLFFLNYDRPMGGSLHDMFQARMHQLDLV